MLVAGTNGINVSAGAADVVYLRGLDIQGSGSGLDGIKFSTGAALHVEKCLIRGFLGSPGKRHSFCAEWDEPNIGSRHCKFRTTIREQLLQGY